MKKIIDNKKYNTETANLIGRWGSGYKCSDFRVCEESLYKKKNGEYFLHGAGGPMSKYSVSRGNGITGGEAIHPLTLAEAKDWGQKNLDADSYEAAFGEVPE